MTISLVKDIATEVFKTVLLASGPVLIVSLLVGLVISFFQAVTQLQEFTLTFVPKILAVFVCLLFFLPWIASTLVDFTHRLFINIPYYIK
ncbi:flagellar biosynthetic protein FliQ [bacterium BMS3Bbin06]|nr:flagellar biosynthetic protein FliQ [bacterium BMS3Abin08]GBE33821.1 flagellar biosynthetic protein FliQ [bacterium BMS3Bbin06]HDO35757.1 flagellar biosynthesis protein FliQ [Nitrospirota bacterium]HDY72049.1 flagellar biosynthesis protein FliQ [Nitrospirota bacterium]